jgi:hypothetical protein
MYMYIVRTYRHKATRGWGADPDIRSAACECGGRIRGRKNHLSESRQAGAKCDRVRKRQREKKEGKEKKQEWYAQRANFRGISLGFR